MFGDEEETSCNIWRCSRSSLEKLSLTMLLPSNSRTNVNTNSEETKIATDNVGFLEVGSCVTPLLLLLPPIGMDFGCLDEWCATPLLSNEFPMEEEPLEVPLLNLFPFDRACDRCNIAQKMARWYRSAQKCYSFRFFYTCNRRAQLTQKNRLHSSSNLRFLKRKGLHRQRLRLIQSDVLRSPDIAWIQTNDTLLLRVSSSHQDQHRTGQKASLILVVWPSYRDPLNRWMHNEVRRTGCANDIMKDRFSSLSFCPQKGLQQVRIFLFANKLGCQETSKRDAW